MVGCNRVGVKKESFVLEFAVVSRVSCLASGCSHARHQRGERRAWESSLQPQQPRMCGAGINLIEAAKQPASQIEVGGVNWSAKLKSDGAAVGAERLTMTK